MVGFGEEAVAAGGEGDEGSGGEVVGEMAGEGGEFGIGGAAEEGNGGKVKGGKGGDAIKPGNSAESSILIRMALPLDDEEHMPPEGKPQIEADEIAIIKWWIDAGAKTDVKVKDAALPDNLK